MISRETLEDFFVRTREMNRSGRAPFNIDEMCLWSFFFIDPSKEKLIPVADHLHQIGYTIKGFLKPGPDDKDPVYFLRADRVEKHTVDTLIARNDEFYAVAAKFGVKDYDGMDVGAVDGP